MDVPVGAGYALADRTAIWFDVGELGGNLVRLLHTVIGAEPNGSELAARIVGRYHSSLSDCRDVERWIYQAELEAAIGDRAQYLPPSTNYSEARR